MVDHVDQYIFDGEYLLIAEDGENLRSRTTPIALMAMGKFWVNNHAHIVRGNNDAVTRFLMYALAEADISGFLTGSTIPKLTQASLNSIPIRTPPISEQRAIAHVLGVLDDKIELNRRTSETLDSITRTLFNSWFVDFDPVHGMADGRDPAVVERLKEFHPNRLVDSPGGSHPEGWELAPLASLVQHVREQVLPASSPEAVFSHYSLPAFDAGQCPKPERGSEIKSQKFRVKPGVVLLSKLNPEIERVWLVDPIPEVTAVCSTEFLVLKPEPPFTRSYIYCLSRSPSFRQQVVGLVTGTSKSHQRARAESVLDVAVVRPPVPFIEAFDRIAAPLLDRTLAARRESRTLAELRDTLLPRLISGELRIREAERFLERAGV